ncbi:MAG TPA: hypothetical protein VN812_23610 [Candidatus Acidoferrales bacterium]|nr:hypothetical protein [Candidatus Acidoferrales bacterium]
MNVKRIMIVIALLAILIAQLTTPTQAYAANTLVTALIIAGAVTAAYVAAVCIATEVHRESRGPFELMPTDTQPPRKQEERGVKFGTRCAQDSAALTVVCW